MLDKTDIGDAIRILRESKNITAQALSLTIGESAYYISRVETGKLKLDFIRAAKIAPVLGIKMQDIAIMAKSLAKRRS
jgi:transcriptional regulator with XRE-family HTH domain